MELRDFLFKIKLCKGIGIRGETKLYNWLIEHDLNFSELTIEMIIKISNLNKKHQARFLSDFKSESLNERIKLNQKKYLWISINDYNYPNQLRESYLPPIILFYRGNINLLDTPLLGIVGSRLSNQKNSNASYSLNKLLKPLCKTNLTTISGLAKGSDTLAHKYSIFYKLNTVGVIASDLDYVYPKENIQLQKEMFENYLVISEYPLNTKPLKSHFVERNRIIAGLCSSLLVVEAKEKSGSLITANLALQNNRNILAVPGSLRDELSIGCNQLILAGARPCLTHFDIIEEM
ncbi:DNA-protecting protein DprA [Lactobacillus sp. S2-2]|uniref:DNA-processing protein DprA n=1 Tax=Lactobacillus sp. S2-2 TaxID=2692917 RepID=UPI001F02A5FC|nr:DNA-processing protein DprA [Lactobacillus sp. S2-2]MCF6515032.1 DNA-protecting protein DprA [Lactobacillus sp. S2-2]